MHWLLLAGIISFCFGFYYFFIKIASGYINEVVGAIILQVLAVFVGLVLLLYLKFVSNTTFEITGKGILFSCLAGIAIGLAEVLTFFLYTKDVPVSIGSPVIIGGSIAVVALLGVLFLKEAVTVKTIIAIILIIAGVVLFTTEKNISG